MLNQDYDRAIIVALGSNLPGAYGSSRELLESVLEKMPVEGIGVLAVSQWWRSRAWPDLTDPDYLNGVAIVETNLQAEQLLTRLTQIESAYGRGRTAQNAPRPLDLDLIAYGRRRIDAPGLTIPHPRAHDRLFVMGPLAEIAPDWIHPGTGLPARRLAETATVGRDAAPLGWTT